VKEVLAPLSAQPGVRIAVLVTADGVPVVVRGRASESRAGDELDERAESLAALAAGWLNGLSRAVAPLSWNPPERVVLKATRGTIVMVQAPGSVLLALIDEGARPEDLRLPMQGAVARIQRILRRNKEEGSSASGEPSAQAPLPTRETNSGQGGAPDPADSNRKTFHRDLSG
jgi:predicted regulator of Ras-like GTPase activity (Roadblock/LC7/MglB family)